jgi:hypothetical protein
MALLAIAKKIADRVEAESGHENPWRGGSVRSGRYGPAIRAIAPDPFLAATPFSARKSRRAALASSGPRDAFGAACSVFTGPGPQCPCAPR